MRLCVSQMLIHTTRSGWYCVTRSDWIRGIVLSHVGPHGYGAPEGSVAIPAATLHPGWRAGETCTPRVAAADFSGSKKSYAIESPATRIRLGGGAGAAAAVGGGVPAGWGPPPGRPSAATFTSFGATCA